MSITLEVARRNLGRAVGRIVEGTATGGSTTTLIDTNGLARFTENDALNGGLLYIVSAGAAAPEGESRRITDYVAASKTITVEYAFTAAPASGDTYEVYLAPLAKEQWDQCVNHAILDAWPELYEVDAVAAAAVAGHTLTLPATAEAVLDVRIVPDQTWAGRPGQRIPPSFYMVEGTPSVNLTLYWLRPFLTSSDVEVQVFYAKRYAELAAEESTLLDKSYLQAAARAQWYALMADSTRNQADAAQFLQLMNHWQEVARVKKQVLGAHLRGITPSPEKGGK